MVRQRGRGYGNRAPPPAGQFDQYMIAPTGPSPEDRWQLLAEERVCRISDRDFTGEAVRLRGRVRGWVSNTRLDSRTRSLSIRSDRKLGPAAVPSRRGSETRCCHLGRGATGELP